MKFRITTYIDNSLSFLLFPLVWLTNNIEFFFTLVLSIVLLSQTNFSFSETLGLVKYGAIFGFIVLELLLVWMIILSDNSTNFLKQLKKWSLLYVFIFYALLTSLLSISLLTSLTAILLFFCLILMTTGIVPFFADSKSKRDKFLFSIYIFINIIIFINLFIFIFIPSMSYTTHIYTRFMGIFDNPNTIGMFNYISLSIVTYFFIIKNTPRWRLYNLFLSGIIIAQIILSFSRSSALGLAVYFLVICFFYNKKLFKAGLILGITFTIIIILSPTLLNLLRLASDPFSLRDILWKIGMQAWNTSKVFGTGYGTTKIITNSPFEFIRHGLTFYLLGKHFHNIYVEVLVETGIVGLTIFISIIVYIFQKTVIKIKTCINESNLHFSKIYLSLLLAVLFQSAFESFLLSPGNVSSIIFWTLTGLVLSQNEKVID